VPRGQREGSLRPLAVPDKKTEITTVGISRADHTTHSTRKKLALTLLTSGDRSVGIARSQTKATELYVLRMAGARGNVVVKVLRQKVACSRPDEVNNSFSICLILPSALRRGVYSVSNRNE
jgi:hypothetical protein